MRRIWLLVLLFVGLLGCAGEEVTDFDGDGASDSTDCGPNDPSIGPGFTDPWGDGVDQNCDGFDGVDADGDGFAANADGDQRDCDDQIASTNPEGADQAGDGADTNCDGVDGVDGDGDGWASEASGGADCDDEDPDLGLARDQDGDGVTDCAGDCDDLDADVQPGADEACDGVDTDCDGDTPTDEVDGDGDGSLACDDCDDADDERERLDVDGDGVTTCAGDCDDEAAPINPFQADLAGDGVDTNCDDVDGIDADEDGEASVGSGGLDCDDGDGAVTSSTDDDGDGATVCGGDCDDADPGRAPTLVEVCANGVDDDCDSEVDTDADLDGDGFDPCTGDCNEASTVAFPGAFDTWGDGVDLNCDGVDGTDADGDGYAGDALGSDADCDDADPLVSPADADGDGVSACDGDCDDGDASIAPFASDTACDGIDSNCVPDPAELDQDGDGWMPCDGDCDDADVGLSPTDADGDGATLCDGDCDDADPNRTPGAVDLACDGFDSDCVFDAAEADVDLDGQLPCEGDCDDANPTMLDVDADFDGVTPCGVDGLPGTADDDCDDANGLVFPGATELCDGLDSDCVVDASELDQDGDGYVACAPWVGTDPNIVGEADCDDTNAAIVPVDADGDGVAGCNGDCDETDAAIYPGAADQACDGLDTNCVADPQEIDADGDGDLPCEGDCDDADPALNIGDADADGWTTCQADCDDADAGAFPFNSDAACDGLDTDCVPDPLEVDDDGDGYVECQPWSGSLSGIVGGGDCDDANALNVPIDADGDGVAGCGGDCDETDASVYPGAPDTSCDGLDTDCVVDVAEIDADGDGVWPCQGDCDDANAAVFPGAIELCNGLDDDCNGGLLLVEIDNDGDGLNECAGNDCDDQDASVSPGTPELCDGVDNNCNGILDDLVDVDGDGWSTCGPDGIPFTGDEDCDDADAAANLTDLDGDGYVTCPTYVGPDPAILGGADCNDANSLQWPGNPAWEEPVLDPDFDCNGASGNDLFDAAAQCISGFGVNQYSGASITFVPDLDGDSIPELAVTATGDETGGQDSGAVFIWLSTLGTAGDNDLSTASITLTGEPGDLVSEELTSAGDVDGDGIDDLLVGAANSDAVAPDAGRVYLVLMGLVSPGTTQPLSTVSVVFEGVATLDRLGRAGPAGDIDGDGLADVVLAASNANQGAGGVYLFYGASVVSGGSFSVSAADITVIGTTSEAARLVGPGGDLDSDQVSDLLVGAAGPGPGALYVYSGAGLSSSGPVLGLGQASWAITGESVGDGLGSHPNATGDFDGDGLLDLVVAARSNDDGGLNAGKVYVLFGDGLSGSSISAGLADVHILGESSNERFASAVGVGDVDGDGLDDLLLGSGNQDEFGSASGKASLFFGSTLAAGGSFSTLDADASFYGAEASDSAGLSLDIGDYDGDGREDLFISAFRADTAAPGAGSSCVVLSPY